LPSGINFSGGSFYHGIPEDLLEHGNPEERRPGGSFGTRKPGRAETRRKHGRKSDVDTYKKYEVGLPDLNSVIRCENYLIMSYLREIEMSYPV